MKALFIILVVLSMIFFIVKAVLSVWQRTKKDVYYNNKLIKYLNEYTLIGYIVLVYAFSISLYLADDYTIAECNFTLIILQRRCLWAKKFIFLSKIEAICMLNQICMILIA